MYLSFLRERSGDSHQFADILAPDLAGARLFRHEGDTIELREEDVQAFHAGTQRQIWTVQAGFDVKPATQTKKQQSE